MIVVVDCGNTHIVCAVAGQEGVTASFRVPTALATDETQLIQDLRAGITRISADDNLPNHAIFASVVPDKNDMLFRALKAVTGNNPLSLKDPKLRLDIDIDIDAPAEIGEDRLVNVAGLNKNQNLPCLIIDFGTATTIDFIDANTEGKPVYRGGIIAPGVHRSHEALISAAAQLSHIKIEPFSERLPVLGRNTKQALESGILWGYVSLIDGLISRLTKEQGKSCLAIATGGLAPLFAPHIPAITQIDADLTLRGLYHIFMDNQHLCSSD